MLNLGEVNKETYKEENILFKDALNTFYKVNRPKLWWFFLIVSLFIDCNRLCCILLTHMSVS